MLNSNNFIINDLWKSSDFSLLDFIIKCKSDNSINVIYEVNKLKFNVHENEFINYSFFELLKHVKYLILHKSDFPTMGIMLDDGILLSSKEKKIAMDVKDLMSLFGSFIWKETNINVYPEDILYIKVKNNKTFSSLDEPDVDIFLTNEDELFTYMNEKMVQSLINRYQLILSKEYYEKPNWWSFNKRTLVREYQNESEWQKTRSIND